MPYTDGQRVDPFTEESDWLAHVILAHGLPVTADTSYREARRLHQEAHVAAAFAGIDVGHFHGAVRKS